MSDESKTCSVCGESKSRSEYYKRTMSPDGLQPLCKLCQKVRDAARYQTVRVSVIGASTRWRKEHPEHYRASRRDLQSRKEAADINFKLRRRLRTRLHHALVGNSKKGSAVEDLGCTIDELRAHLEAQFAPGMSWDNWTSDGWHIDHKKPLESFDLTDREQLKAACHYTNLQPLWALDNLSKGSRAA